MAGCHVVKADEGAAIIGVGLFAFAKNGAREAAAEHTVRGHGSAQDSGNSFGAFDGVAEKLLAVIGVITQGAKVEIHLQKILRLEAGIEFLGILHAAQKQSRADERHKSQSNFRNHQQAAQAIVRPAEGAATATGFQYFIDVRARRFDGGDDAEDQAGKHGNQQRKPKHAGIERKINRAVEKKGRPEGPQQIASPVGHQQASHSAHQRKHRAFRQELADKTGAACAHGSANAQLLFTLGGLRKQKIGKIDAGDQEDEADDAHEHAAGKRELLSLIDAQCRFVQRKEFNRAALVVARVLFFKADGDRLHGSAGLVEVKLRFQPADDGEPAEAAVVFPVLELPGEHVVAHGDGNPEQVRTAERDYAFETRWRDAHDGVGRAVQQDGLADELVVRAEFSRP